MNNKIFYFDTETTGLNPHRHDIIQLAYIVEIDGKIVDENSFRLQPFNYDTIEKAALEVNKITIEQLKTYPQPRLVHGQMVNLLDKYVDKYNKMDKFLPAGYKVQFDMDMFRQFFFKNNHKYFGIGLDAHDALSDIKATRKLIHKLMGYLK